MSIRHEDLSVREVPVRQLLLADFSGSKPWRDVRSVRGMAHYSGKYASVTAGGHVVHESRLELARLLLADFDPEVRGIFAQPCRLTARVGDRVRHHVPDFPMAMRSGTVRVVNVKPADRLLDAKIAEALAWPGELFQQHGWATRSGPEPIVCCWRNIRFLAGYRRPGVVPENAV
ncbi:TnsA-like heteromeric transposase endonuclease subunit [Streptomyces sp. NPDC020747]|uniref:TnsA-like heteromeric transposase endonuclease subunit n=1 Tax=Streptomyces sp. NPDC020747 TaxID=3365086 RepID=UPI00378906CD